MSKSKSLWNIDLKEETDSKGFEQYRKKLPEKFQNLYPLRAVISGASGSGKTHVIKRLVFHYYKPILSAVFLFSGTQTTIEEFQKIHEKMNKPFVLKTFEDYSDDKVNEIVEVMKEKRKPSMFIFEDLAFKNIMSKQKSNAIDRLYQTSRHYNVSVITTAQRYSQLNPSSRMNNSNLVLVFNANETELDKLYNEHGNHLSKEEFKDAFRRAVDENHKFMCIDYTENDFHRRLKDSELNPLCITIKDDLKDEITDSKPKTKSKDITDNKTEDKAVNKTEDKQDVNNKTEEKQDVKIKGITRGDKGKEEYKVRFEVNGKEEVLPIHSKNLSKRQIIHHIKKIRDHLF
jgi:hypothetical protein